MNRWRDTVRKVSRVLLAIGLIMMPWGTLSSSVPSVASCDWLLHVSALAGLTVLVFLAFETAKVRIWAVILVFLYSALLEFLQHFNPARHGTIEDVLANALGCVAALLVYYVTVRARAVAVARATALVETRRCAREPIE